MTIGVKRDSYDNIRRAIERNLPKGFVLPGGEGALRIKVEVCPEDTDLCGGGVEHRINEYLFPTDSPQEYEH